MSEVVTDFVKKYVAEYGTLPSSVDQPSDRTDDSPTENTPRQPPKPSGAK